MSERAHVVYIVGEPGVGKSTALGKLTELYDREVVSHKLAGGPARETLSRDGQAVAVELGRREGKHPVGFPGTDAMSMSAIVGVESWLVSGAAAAETGLILGEGARLANRRLIKAVIKADARLTVVYLHDPAGAAARRQGRGGGQNEAWVRGQGTRAANFYQIARDAMVHTDADVHCEYVPAEHPERILDVLHRVTGLDRSPVA
jgi:hypothetical protein